MNAPTHGLADYATLWRNPAFVRFCRSRLRFRKSVFWYLLTLVIVSFVVTASYLLNVNLRQMPPEFAAREVFLPLLVMQGLILMGKGTPAVSAGLIQDKMGQTLDYQRLTPMTPLRSVLGYLFGLPVLEYVMTALTLPHLAFIVAVGNIPLSTVATVYTAFFTCAVLYHLTGLAAGMVMQRWVLGYALSMLLVFGVNFVLPLVISLLGLNFLRYLSIWPVIGQEVIPLVAQLSPVALNNPFLSAADVPFFNWQLSPFAFTLALQSALIVTLGVMAVRRWRSATRHSLSKPYALGFLAAFVVLLLGNVWPAITNQYLPFTIFGATRLDEVRGAIGLGVPLVYAAVTWSLCLLLFAIAIPSHHHYMRGIRRALKQGRTAARPWESDAAAIWFLGLFVAVALAGLGVLYREIGASGFLDSYAASELWRLPVACGLVLFYTAMVVLVLELRVTALIVLVVWLVPILVSIVLGMYAQNVTNLQGVVAGLSPIAYLAASGLMPLTGIANVPPFFPSGPLATTANVGLAVIVAQIAFLLWRWRMLDARFKAACAPAGPATAASATVTAVAGASVLVTEAGASETVTVSV